MYVCGPDCLFSQPHRPHGRPSDFRHDPSDSSSTLGTRRRGVVNITDVDDKLIVQAQKRRNYRRRAWPGRSHPRLPRLSAAALGVDGIDHMPRATEHISEIIAINQALILTRDSHATNQGETLLFRTWVRGPSTASSATATPKTCLPGRGSSLRSRSIIPAISRSGNAQSPASRHGPVPGVRDARAGTLSARR